MNGNKAAVCGALLLAACASQNPERQEMAAGAQDKAVLLAKVDQAPGNYPYTVSVCRYDAPNRTIVNSFDSCTTFRVDMYSRYVATTVTPGTYIFHSISKQEYWSACYGDNSLSFEVKPGELLYLGQVNPLSALLLIETQAAEKGELRGGAADPHAYFDEKVTPDIKFESDTKAQLSSVQDYIRTSMPKVHGEVRLADYRPAKFATGKPLLSLLEKRVCGGWYRASVKE